MDTEIREIALEENDELSHEVDAIVGEWDILEFCYRINWFTNWRVRHYQGCTNSSWYGIYMYGGTYAIIVAHAMHT